MHDALRAEARRALWHRALCQLPVAGLIPTALVGIIWNWLAAFLLVSGLGTVCGVGLLVLHWNRIEPGIYPRWERLVDAGGPVILALLGGAVLLTQSTVALGALIAWGLVWATMQLGLSVRTSRRFKRQRAEWDALLRIHQQQD